MKLLSYELRSTQVLICFTDGKTEAELLIDRVTFETYITNGSGYIEYVLDSYEPQTGHSQNSSRITMADIWEYARDINNTPMMSYLDDYVQHRESIRLDMQAAIEIERILSEIQLYAEGRIGDNYLDLLRRSLRIYGTSCQLIGINRLSEQNAAAA